MATQHVVSQRNQDATCFVGSLADEVDEELLWELFTQVGAVVDVSMPKDSVTGEHRGFAFVEMRSALDAEYACRTLGMLRLCGKPIRVDRSSSSKEQAGVGAKLYVGGLSPEVDEKLLHDTFAAFGMVSGQPRVQHDAETGAAKGFGFVEFDSFEAADRAIEAMNGQYLAGRPLTIQYAFKRDEPGVRHGTHAERVMAAARKSSGGGGGGGGGGAGGGTISLAPHTRFATAPGQAPQPSLPGQPPPHQLAPGPGMPPPLPAHAMMMRGPPPVPESSTLSRSGASLADSESKDRDQPGRSYEDIVRASGAGGARAREAAEMLRHLRGVATMPRARVDMIAVTAKYVAAGMLAHLRDADERLAAAEHDASKLRAKHQASNARAEAAEERVRELEGMLEESRSREAASSARADRLEAEVGALRSGDPRVTRDAMRRAVRATVHLQRLWRGYDTRRRYRHLLRRIVFRDVFLPPPASARRPGPPASLASRDSPGRAGQFADASHGARSVGSPDSFALLARMGHGAGPNPDDLGSARGADDEQGRF
ncbi:hypothetical protein FNF27_00729 [Cafeteria roenbergensis]|uniref:RRM domain-containing protein n=1 Tax=Cafeteria roenbergensis TaxID=33653 RepID=A0A5A8EIY3_CAFRO|nr:hypothetical protein FNF27_00729 [Cafeteria roenbergensis]